MKRAAALLLAAASSLAAAADSLEAPLAAAGDAQRGRGVFVQREQGHCVICHALSDMAPAGNVGPALDGIGARLTLAQLRQRVVDITAVKPDAAMPAFHRSSGLNRVAAAYAGKTLLDAQQVEDLVNFLGGLK
ncbi:MAG: sulfur oxidation c-type cytochrome SoxX [Rhodocyclales bacterium]|nr:sulfur oxidation c-type cytochrome SoxX [Rhodocyclales bacterium]